MDASFPADCITGWTEFETIDKKPLAAGSFGEVRRVVHKKTGEIYAVKMAKGEQQLKQSEIMILTAVDHPFLLCLKYYFEDAEERPCLVTEYLEGGRLLDCVDNRPLTEELVRFYAAELVLAIEYLHKVGCIYRDFKPENLMLDKYYHLNLIDFGFRKVLGNELNTGSSCGSVGYVAPEVSRCRGKVKGKVVPYGKSADCFGIGAIMYKCITGTVPFNGADIFDVLKKIETCDTAFFGSPAVKGVMSKEMMDLLKHLITANLKKRFDIDQIKNHPWFRNHVNWDEVYRAEGYGPLAGKQKQGEETRTIVSQ